MMNRELNERADKIKFFLMDVDGVLTDGRLYYDDGGRETKVFNIHDGHGIRLMHEAGIKVGFLSGRKSRAVEVRAKELSIEECHLGVVDKIGRFNEILKKHRLDESEVAYIGDDLPDLPVLKRVGLSISVSSGIEEVKDLVHWVTKKPGGLGAVREAIDFILSAKKGENKKNKVGFFKK
jgi:3-deoxy-D-manno-octulosonate 8-phosphate phosphatase (KDO 8-P phosphatase)